MAHKTTEQIEFNYLINYLRRGIVLESSIWKP